METINTTSGMGQQTGAPTQEQSSRDAQPKNDVGELLRLMEQNCKAFVRTVAVLTSFGARLDAIEARLGITPSKEGGR